MRIVIETDGGTEHTKVLLNGKEQVGLKEFHFSMNPHKKRGDFLLKGKCKMQMGFNGDFRSYFGEDFVKFGEFVKEGG